MLMVYTLRMLNCSDKEFDTILLAMKTVHQPITDQSSV